MNQGGHIVRAVDQETDSRKQEAGRELFWAIEINRFAPTISH